MTTSRTRLFFVLLTHGRKPTARPHLHEAASGQLANLRSAFPVVDGIQDRFYFEYARKIRRLDDLAALKRTLAKVIRLRDGVLIMDDLSRLFRCCEK